MYEALKGVARRTTQSLRERVNRTDVAAQDAEIMEVAKKVRSLDAKSRFICERVIKVAKLMEELGSTLKEIGEAYGQAPDLVTESRELAEDVHNVGMRLVETSLEHQKGLKDKGFGVLHDFTKHCSQLEETESRRRDAQLEYDFFFNKVVQLRQDPPKDVSRIPRNEHTLENWRVELWQATESNKALLSSLYTEGRRAIDTSVLTTVQVVHSFVDIASTGFKQTFFNMRLPEYSDEPVLVPAPLPPNPLPPFQPPNGVYGYSYYGGTTSTPSVSPAGTATTTQSSSSAPPTVASSLGIPSYDASRRTLTAASPQYATSPPVAHVVTNPPLPTAALSDVQTDSLGYVPSHYTPTSASGYQPPQVLSDAQVSTYTPPPTT